LAVAESSTLREEIREKERNRRAGEIHDWLAQSLAGVAMQLDAAQEVIKTRRSDGLSYGKRANDLAQFGLVHRFIDLQSAYLVS
jgi:signal transduction histidine kinase